MLLAVPIHEGVHHFSRRSSSAWAKKRAGQLKDFLGAAKLEHFALQFLGTIDLRCGHAFALTRVTIVLAHPVQQRLRLLPILQEIDTTAAYCDSCAPRCWNTMRTAGSRTPAKTSLTYA